MPPPPGPIHMYMIIIVGHWSMLWSLSWSPQSPIIKTTGINMVRIQWVLTTLSMTGPCPLQCDQYQPISLLRFGHNDHWWAEAFTLAMWKPANLERPVKSDYPGCFWTRNRHIFYTCVCGSYWKFKICSFSQSEFVLMAMQYCPTVLSISKWSENVTTSTQCTLGRQTVYRGFCYFVELLHSWMLYVAVIHIMHDDGFSHSAPLYN